MSVTLRSSGTLALVCLLATTLTSCDYVNNFGNNDATNEFDFLAVKIAGQDNWSIVDVNTGNFLYENEFKNKPSVIIDDRFFVQRDNGDGYECFDVNDISKPLNNKSFAHVTYFQNGVALVNKKDEPVSIINREGVLVKELDKIKSAFPFKNGFATIINEDKKVGFVNSEGNIVVTPKYDRAFPFSADGFAVVEQRQNDTISNFIIIDQEGQKLFSFSSEKYTPISGMVDGSMAVVKNDRVLYIDKEGNRVVTAGKYLGNDRVYGMYDGISVFAGDNDKYGLINEKGDKLIRDKYDLIYPVKNGMFIVQRDDKVGVINKNDEKILDIDYIAIFKLKKNRFLVKEGENLYAIVDEKGNEVTKETLCDVSFNYNDLIIANDWTTRETEFGESDDKDTINIIFDNLNNPEYRAVIEDYTNQLMYTGRTMHDIVSNSVLSLDQIVDVWRLSLSKYYLTEEDLMFMDPTTMRLMRNAIFANHNYIFKSADLAEFYSHYSWYVPTKKDVAAEMNQVELFNIKFIKEHE